MTIWAHLRRRRLPAIGRPEPRLFSVADGSQVLAHCNWQHPRERRPVLLALHGLEGSSDAPYMKGIADKAFRAGFSVVRLNHRNCGGTEHLTKGLYHSGLTSDASEVMREMIERDGVGQIALAGYSLGGNVALKLAGELGKDAPPQLSCVAAVSPPIDLPAATVLLERRANCVYQRYFLRSLRRRIRRKASLFPGVYAADGLRRIRTVRAFDDRYTSRLSGFRDAADYYDRASSIRVIARIALPALIISAADDPFIPPEPLRDPRVAGNPHVQVLLTPHGGHCGFVSARCTEHDGFWAEWKVVQFAGAYCQVEGRR